MEGSLRFYEMSEEEKRDYVTGGENCMFVTGPVVSIGGFNLRNRLPTEDEIPGLLSLAADTNEWVDEITAAEESKIE